MFIQENDGKREDRDNLTKGERYSIKQLKRNNDITIKPADKGGSITIMDTNDYISEAESQLSNEQFYKSLPKDFTKSFKREVNHLLAGLGDDIKKATQNLIPNEPKPGTFYCLPNLHKLPKLTSEATKTNPEPIGLDTLSTPTKIYDLAKSLHITPPGRPIISGRGTLTEHLSGYIDSILNPLLINIPSFTQDSTHFLRKLSNVQQLNSDALLVTLDVTSLYSNIPHEEGVAACTKFLNRFYSYETTSDICSIIEFILKHNNFMFNEKHFLQTKGTAMGTRMAPSYANIFMADLEDRILSNYHLKPTFYTRYIDDIFLIWEHGLDSLKQFETYINNIHPSIKFTLAMSRTEILFLDITTMLHNGDLSTTIYSKPTDNHKYLDYFSFHPMNLKRSIVYSQVLRLKRICSEPTDYAKQSIVSRITVHKM
ncbi:uncharacterized protein LOC117121033 [Anneissia japonica]|uniref:uncharacterized protein LOC117121033 n=1 Tax=Anneissia japonica TaxID=1529436 RepID=UPI0014255D13|nr:uncharacterized protein LOC117121033 [Anneissia japonica]